jgi:hypothetical protein
MIVPIELRMIGENLQPASHQKKDAKQIDEMIDPQPNGKAEIGRVWVHRASLSFRSVVGLTTWSFSTLHRLYCSHYFV